MQASGPISRQASPPNETYGLTSLPTDVLIEIFKNLQTSRVMPLRVVCRRWNVVIMTHLRRILPMLRCRDLGVRMCIGSFFRLASLHAQGIAVLHKLDLSGVYSIQTDSLAQTQFTIRSLVLKRSRISKVSLGILLSRIVSGGSLKVNRVQEITPDEVFDILGTQRVTLGKLSYVTKQYVRSIDNDRCKAAFSHFVKNGGLVNSECRLNLKNQKWINGTLFHDLAENNVRLSALNVVGTQVCSQDLAVFINQDGLNPVCDLKFAPKGIFTGTEYAALLKKGVKFRNAIKLIDRYSLSTVNHETLYKSFFSESEAGHENFVPTIKLARLAEALTTSLIPIRKLNFSSENSNDTAACLQLISGGNWASMCDIKLRLRMLSDEILTALTQREITIKRLGLDCPSYDKQKMEKLFTALSKRQKTLELHIRPSEESAQGILDALGRSSLELTRFVWGNYQFYEHSVMVHKPVDLNAFANRLMNCRHFECYEPVKDWIQPLSLLIDSEIREMQLLILPNDRDLISFLEKSRFRCLMRLTLICIGTAHEVSQMNEHLEQLQAAWGEKVELIFLPDHYAE